MPFGALRPSGRLRERKDLFGIFCLISLLALTGCGFLSPGASDTASSETVTQSDSVLPPPPPAPATLGQIDTLAAAGPISLSPGGALGSLGLNLDTYFEEELLSPHQRIERVERVVTAMQRDLARMAPPIQRLVSVESDIRALITQLASLSEEEAMPATPTPYGGAPASAEATGSAAVTASPSLHPPPGRAEGPAGLSQPAPTGSQRQSGGQTAAAQAGDVRVERVRIGEHKDKTRIVLDVNKPTSYRYDLDNSENLLVIEVPDAGWDGIRKWQSDRAPLLAGYQVYDMEDGGSRVIVQLKHGVRISDEMTIKPNGYKDYRIVLDLHSGAVHAK